MADERRSPSKTIDEPVTFGERLADAVAAFGGSWTFIIIFLLVLVAYAAENVYLGSRAWDPYPFILLNLFLSMLAAIQAPVIMMSQNRQDQKDRLRGQKDYEVDRRAEREIRALAKAVEDAVTRLERIEDELRQGKSL